MALIEIRRHHLIYHNHKLKITELLNRTCKISVSQKPILSLDFAPQKLFAGIHTNIHKFSFLLIHSLALSSQLPLPLFKQFKPISRDRITKNTTFISPNQQVKVIDWSQVPLVSFHIRTTHSEATTKFTRHQMDFSVDRHWKYRHCTKTLVKIITSKVKLFSLSLIQELLNKKIPMKINTCSFQYEITIFEIRK